MSTKTLTGVYPGGYSLADGVTELIVGPTARVYGSGVSAAFVSTVINYGTIAATSHYGIDLRGGGTVVNGAIGAMIAGGPYGIHARYGAATVTNLGTIQGTAEGIDLNAGGRVTNGSTGVASASISGSAYGVEGRFAALAVTNEGTIAATSGAGVMLMAGGRVSNGAAQATSARISGSTVGIYALDAPIVVTNFGTVTGAGSAAVQMAAGGALTNGSSATTSAMIWGYFDGVYLSNRLGDVTNFGTIIGAHLHGVQLLVGRVVVNGAATSPAALISGYFDGIYTGDKGSRVTNLGTVQGLHSNAVLLAGGGYVGNGGVADSGAQLTGYLNGIYAGAQYTSVVNLGSITGLKSAGIDLRAGGSVINGATSTTLAVISGQVGVYASAMNAATIVNYGRIIGTAGEAVIFKSGADRLIAEAGSSFVGAIAGGGGALELATGAGTLSGIGGPGTVSGSQAITFSGFGSYQLDAGSTWLLSGHNVLAAAQTLSSAGALTINGVLSGAGTLDIAGGVTTLVRGASTSQLHWTQTGGVISLAESLAYRGFFRQGAGALIDLGSGDRLFLAAPAVLEGTFAGAGSALIGSALVHGLVIGGSVALAVSGVVNQAGGITVGNSGPGAASLVLLKGSAWHLGAGGIARGAANASRIVDEGLLIKDSAPAESIVAVPIIDYGVIEAAAGRLDLSQSIAGSGALRIDAGAVLEIDAAASGLLTASFAGAGATLALASPASFSATIAGFAFSDTIDLLGLAATAASINGADQLVIANGTTTVATLRLTGSYAGATFSIKSDGAGGADITLLTPAVSPPPRAARGLLAAMATMPSPAAAPISSGAPGEWRAPTLTPPGYHRAGQLH